MADPDEFTVNPFEVGAQQLHFGHGVLLVVDVTESQLDCTREWKDHIHSVSDVIRVFDEKEDT